MGGVNMDFNNEQKEILTNALRTWGFTAQTDIAIEEMSELTKAIIKERRYSSSETFDNLREEIADVMIMCEQLYMFTDPDRIQEIINKKLERLKERLSRGEKDVP